MALSGSQKAYTYARSGVARSGSTRSNYYIPNVVIWIMDNGVMTDWSQHVRHLGWSVSLNLNDDIDTATVSLLPSLHRVIQPRSQITISLGSRSNLIFAGIVMTVQSIRKPGTAPLSTVWHEITCVDWTAVLDAHLVVEDYPAQSVSTTIADIVNRFTAAGISLAGVPANLPTISGFQVVNERPSTILRRITNAIGGGFYLDADRVLRAWSSSIPSPIQDTAPSPLTDTNTMIKSWRVTSDASQQRTRVFVEGMRTETLAKVDTPPAGASAYYGRVPVTDATAMHAYNDAQGGHPERMTRVGAQFSRAHTVVNPVVDLATKNPVGTTTTVGVAIGQDNMPVVSTAGFPSVGWLRAGDQVLPYTVGSGTSFSLSGGDLKAPISLGEQVTLLPSFAHDAVRRKVDPVNLLEWNEPTTAIAQPLSTAVVLVAVRQDDQAANAIKVKDTSDGYYEHLVQDGRYTSAGAIARADAELASFAAPLVSYEWATEDFNAVPGVMQHVDFVYESGTAGGPFDVRITNVTITPIATNYPPLRQVRAAPIQAAGVLDIWLDDTR